MNGLYLTMFKDTKKPPAERVSDFDAQAKELISMLAIANSHLSGRQFFALDRLTVADMALGPILKRCVAFPIDIPSFSNLGRWITHLDSPPGVPTRDGRQAHCGLVRRLTKPELLIPQRGRWVTCSSAL